MSIVQHKYLSAPTYGFDYRPNPIMEIDDEEIHEILSRIETTREYNPTSHVQNIAILYYVLQLVMDVVATSDYDEKTIFSFTSDKHDIGLYRQVIRDIFATWGIQLNQDRDGDYSLTNDNSNKLNIDIDNKVHVLSHHSSYMNVGQFNFDIRNISSCSFFEQMWFMKETTDNDGFFTMDLT